MADSVFSLNRNLSYRLSSMVQDLSGAAAAELRSNPPPESRNPLRIVITANEVNGLHGTGPLVKRICRGWTNVVSIRARNDWGGEQDFGDWKMCLLQRARSRRSAQWARSHPLAQWARLDPSR